MKEQDKSMNRDEGSINSLISSVSVKEIFQRVTDAWSLKFVRQQENCESQWLPVLSVLESHCPPSNTNKNHNAALSD